MNSDKKCGGCPRNVINPDKLKHSLICRYNQEKITPKIKKQINKLFLISYILISFIMVITIFWLWLNQPITWRMIPYLWWLNLLGLLMFVGILFYFLQLNVKWKGRLKKETNK